MASLASRNARPGQGLCVRLDGKAAFDVPHGAYGCLLGPAGAGKRMLLRAVCGLDRVAGGVAHGGIMLEALPPARRRIALLAQGGSIAGHASVGAALRTALAWRGVPRARRSAAAAALAEEFALDLPARPSHLSPDLRLRARLAVALAGHPVLLLADDPLAACDDPAAAIDLFRAAQRRRSLTVLHATTRPTEAYALADHLVLLQAGRVLQEGATAQVYDRPQTLQIALRLGPVNVLPGSWEQTDDDVAIVRLDCGPVIEADPPDWAAALPARCQVVLRPERISVSRVAAAELGGAAISGMLRDRTGGGEMLRLTIAIGADAELAVLRPTVLGAVGLIPGQPVSVAWQSRHALLFPA